MRLNNFIILSSLILLVSASSVHSQDNRMGSSLNLSRYDDKHLHFGFYLGVNTFDFNINHYPNVTDNPVLGKPGNEELAAQVEKYYEDHNVRVDVNPLSLGFTVGVVTDLRLTKSLSLRATPGMSFGARKLKYNYPINKEILINSGTEGLTEDSYLNIPSAYIDMPIGIRYYGNRFQNTRPYIFMGGTYRYDLDSKRGNNDKAIHLKKHGAYLDIGLGLNTYLSFFRLTTEFRASLGLNNIIKHNTGTGASDTPYYGFIIDKLNSNTFSLIFYFE